MRYKIIKDYTNGVGYLLEDETKVFRVEKLSSARVDGYASIQVSFSGTGTLSIGLKAANKGFQELMTTPSYKGVDNPLIADNITEGIHAIQFDLPFFSLIQLEFIVSGQVVLDHAIICIQ